MDTQKILGALGEFKEHTITRLDKIEHKLDGLHGFKWQVTGGVLVASFIISLAVSIYVTKN